jgi:hypothetical protein
MLRSLIDDATSLKIKYKDNNFIFVPSILLVVVGFGVHYFWGFEAAIIVELPLITFFILSMVFHLYRKVEADLEEERIQSQALQSIYRYIDPRYPLPSMSRWTAFPDLAEHIIRECMQQKPRCVVELGSGISTLITAYALEKYGSSDAKIISLDHSETYAKRTQELIKQHQLEHRAQVIYSPLQTTIVNEKSYSWYALDPLELDHKIDLLLVDGPPVKTNKMARYPAVPLLYTYFSEQCTVLLDDAARKSEQSSVQHWLDDYPDLRHTYIGNKKGLSIIKRGL